jgi:hypothetical protein
VSNTDFGFRLGWSDWLLPGWQLSSDVSAPGNRRVPVDAPAPGGWDSPILYTTNTSAHVSPVPPPIFGPQQPLQIVVEGRNSLLLASWFGPEGVHWMAVAQTGEIPPGAQSLHFLNYGESIDVFVNGSFVPSVCHPRTGFEAPVSDVYTDISAFSGQTVELRFSASLRRQSILWHGLDSIGFSSDQVPGAEVFTRVTEGDMGRDSGQFSTCAWADANNDFYVDLFVGIQNSTNGILYRSQRDGTFTPLWFGGGEICTGTGWGDYNNDAYVYSEAS